MGWCRQTTTPSLPPGSDKKRKMSDEPESGVNMVEGVNAAAEAFHIDLDDDDDDDFVGGDIAQQDGGTASVFGSAWQIKKYLRFLLEEGFDVHSVPMCHCEEGFKYGKSPKETTNRCVVLPILWGSKRVDVLTYVIKGTAPILVGRPLLEQLGLHLGHDICKCINDEPHKVLLPENTEAHVGEPNEQGIQRLLEEVMVAEDTSDVSSPQQPSGRIGPHTSTRRHSGRGDRQGRTSSWTHAEKA